MTNTKKGIIGLALLTSLSVFAGTTANKTTTTNGTQPACTCPAPGQPPQGQPPQGQPGQNGQENKDGKKLDPKKIDEIKSKLKENKKLTADESKLLLEMLEMGQKPGQGQGPNGQPPQGQPGQAPTTTK